MLHPIQQLNRPTDTTALLLMSPTTGCTAAYPHCPLRVDEGTHDGACAQCQAVGHLVTRSELAGGEERLETCRRTQPATLLGSSQSM
jgi:hypothetical protein